jgi:chromosome segregation ATPase
VSGGRRSWHQPKKGRDPVGIHSQEQRRERSLTAKADPMIAVLDAADESSRTATRRKAERVRTLLSDLRSTIAAEKAEDEQKAAARTEIERLERELAKAKARLRGRTTLTVASSVSAADLRKWAHAQGIDCPPLGRVPNAVRDAYEALDKEAS